MRSSTHVPSVYSHVSGICAARMMVDPDCAKPAVQHRFNRIDGARKKHKFCQTGLDHASHPRPPLDNTLRMVG
eukprot:m.478071 g.478071  ORF g.478071 m.478071 type:complete len:73 (-) comp45533_c0_seq1:8-226(-)